MAPWCCLCTHTTQTKYLKKRSDTSILGVATVHLLILQPQFSCSPKDFSFWFTTCKNNEFLWICLPILLLNMLVVYSLLLQYWNRLLQNCHNSVLQACILYHKISTTTFRFADWWENVFPKKQNLAAKQPKLLVSVNYNFSTW